MNAPRDSWFQSRKPANDRILHIPRRFVKHEWGGTETAVLELSRVQQELGYRPEVFTSLALADNRSESIGGIHVRRFGYFYPYFGLSDAYRAAMDKSGGNLMSWSLMTALLTAPNVRLFHAHTLKRLGGIVRTAARIRRRPYVVSLHGGVFDVPAEQREAMDEAPHGSFEWGKVLGALVGARRVLNDADLVLCVGSREFELAKQHLHHDRVAHLPNAVRPEKFAGGDGAGFRRRHRVPDDAFLILNVGRIDRQKNQLLLLEAFAKFHARTRNAHLALLGPITQPDYAEKLKALVRAQGLEGAVTMISALAYDDPDLVNAYHACDVFALPSMHEPFGIVVLEAWSSARPVVVSHVGGLRSLVKEGETGFFVDPTAADAAERLARICERMYEQPALRREVAANGLREVHEHYSWPAIGEQVERLYCTAERHARGSSGRARRSESP